jgi:hypothetical protein
MAISGELKVANSQSSAQLVPTGTKTTVHAIQYRTTSSAGSIELFDGGSGGTSKGKFWTPAFAEGDGFPFPAGGLHFDDGVYVDLTNVDGVTILYQEE